MPDFLSELVNSSEFMPHGFCLRWNPALVLLFNVSNIAIAAAYFAIPLALFYFVRKRKDLAFSWIFRMFAAFIWACGVTHLMKVWTIYHGSYWAEALMDTWTAVISVATALILWPLIPKALALRSPAELESINLELKSVNERLNSANSELSVLNDDLELARDKALEASNLKSAFVANISHELRTPLSAILGLNELMLLTDLNDDQQNYAQTIHAAAASLLNIVNDVLDLSKIESGKMEIATTSINPVALLKDSVRLLQDTVNQKGLSLKLVIDEKTPTAVIGDPVRLSRVLLNIIGNAVKFTEAGSILVEGIVEQSSKERVRLKFVVVDTGIGISESEQKLLFLPFTQVDSASTRKFGGTGLGLAISKRLVELMGGEIGLVSRKGEGSTFWFSVPFQLSEVEASTAPASPSRSERKAPIIKVAAGGSKMVLVVEDNPVLRELILKQLKSISVEAIAVTTGEEAIQEIDGKDFAAVLMDCHLPQMDGFEATKIIRQRESSSGKRLPIIAMTAGAMKGDQERCLAAGMDDYLSKPYTIEELKNKLLSWMPK